jgi:Xaa-Pro aminopeptidase
MVFYERALSGLGLQKQWDAMQSYQFLYAGHGIGLDIHEPPFISAVDQSHLEAGMTLAIEPDVFFNLPLSEQTVALKPENDVLITAEGAELLTTSSTEIWRSR